MSSESDGHLQASACFVHTVQLTQNMLKTKTCKLRLVTLVKLCLYEEIQPQIFLNRTKRLVLIDLYVMCACVKREPGIYCTQCRNSCSF